MIEIICDNCERTFEVADELGGGKAPCPSCGDINRVPGPAGPSPAARPRAPRREETEAERDVRVVRPAMFRAHPFLALLLLALVFGGVAGGIYGFAQPLPWLGWAGLVFAGIGVIWWGIWWLAAHLWVRVTISNKRTIWHEGIIKRHSTEVLHDHVRSVDIRQTFLQRIFNVGYIGIDSAGQDGVEIQIRDIPAPYEIKKLIDRYRRM
jgi:membrane protein YdbS with pleckstrin-like domain